MQELAKLKASQIAALVKAVHEANQADSVRTHVFIWGAPGIGKTELLRGLTGGINPVTEREVGFVYRSLAQEDACDAKGVPYVKDGKTLWGMPHWFPAEDTEGIILLDDFPHAMAATQHSALELLNEHPTLNGVPLPPGWTVVATGNRVSDRAGAGKVQSAIAGRCLHVEQVVDLDDWTNWAIDKGLRAEVVAYNRFKKSALHDFDPARDDLAYCSPRSWAKVASLINTLPNDLLLPAIQGTVGHAHAIEFVAFLRIWRELPNPDAVLMKPDDAVVPTKMDVLYALTGALCMRVNQENAGRFVRFASRLSPEWSVMMIDYALKTPASASVQTCPEWTAWFQKHGAIMGIS